MKPVAFAMGTPEITCKRQDTIRRWFGRALTRSDAAIVIVAIGKFTFVITVLRKFTNFLSLFSGTRSERWNSSICYWNLLYCNFLVVIFEEKKYDRISPGPRVRLVWTIVKGIFAVRRFIQVVSSRYLSRCTFHISQETTVHIPTTIPIATASAADMMCALDQACPAFVAPPANAAVKFTVELLKII